MFIVSLLEFGISLWSQINLDHAALRSKMSSTFYSVVKREKQRLEILFLIYYLWQHHLAVVSGNYLADKRGNITRLMANKAQIKSQYQGKLV